MVSPLRSAWLSMARILPQSHLHCQKVRLFALYGCLFNTNSLPYRRPISFIIRGIALPNG
jgi:hypothetical protein